jgi:hypothetical protein
MNPQKKAECDMHTIVDSMEWSIASAREIDGRKTTVKNATPSEEFWSAWCTARGKAMVKAAGLSLSKNDEGNWIVEWVLPEDTPQVDKQKPAIDPVVKIPPGEAQEAPSLCPDTSADVVMVPIDKIVENPANKTLYDPVVNSAILESVELNGVLVPVQILPSGMLLDGWQRWESARAAGLKVIPAHYVVVDEEKQIEAILAFNAQRIKNLIELLREYREYLRIEKAKANERTGLRTDTGTQLPEGHREWGKARDLAAKKVGLSGSTAERGLRVLEEIERRSGSGEAEAALKLLTEQGIDAAWKFAYAHGWIDSVVKGKKQKGLKASNGKPESTETTLDDNDASSGEDRSESELTVGGWLTDDVINLVITDVAPPDGEEADELRSTISFLRPRLYLIAGTTLSVVAVNKLRVSAKALEALADKISEMSTNTKKS